jgi:hypothetical protein
MSKCCRESGGRFSASADFPAKPFIDSRFARPFERRVFPADDVGDIALASNRLAIGSTKIPQMRKICQAIVLTVSS